MYLGCCCDVSQGPVGGTGISGFPGLRVSISFAVLSLLLMSYNCLIGSVFDLSFTWLTVVLLSLFVLVSKIACLSIFLSLSLVVRLGFG